MEPLYPDPCEVLDPRFRFKGDMRLEQLHEGSRWAEGPVYVPAGRYLLWSDIPNDRILRWDETTGAVGVFRSPAGHPNGHALDAAGRLVSCEQGARRITRTEHDGSVTVLAERYRGKRLNSPNDLVIADDGAIWFTDPTYGIKSDYEGVQAESELGVRNLYRLEPVSGECAVMADGFTQPTGIGFAPDGSRLYVADSGANHLLAFDVKDDGTLGSGEVFASADAVPRVHFDSLDIDTDGRIWLAVGAGVRCYDPDGTLLGRILTPESASHVTFGGPKRNRLFITASTSLYAITLTVTGRSRPYDTTGE
ncbi:gluconolactonase [Streptacidiphilus sp. MAP12-20]|uniref:SMP-30/gluconolactonase/LRE family protein n=1 Tax=Streptacidiphilus sp. MAP12-20 TaxID=3156299 RepID=UPI0035192593